MKRTVIVLISAMSAVLFLAACSGPYSGEENLATITLQIGSGNSRTASYPPAGYTGAAPGAPDPVNDLAYTVIIGSTTVLSQETADASKMLQFQFAPGSYTIMVQAFEIAAPGNLYAGSSLPVNIQAGPNSFNITMHQAGPRISYDSANKELWYKTVLTAEDWGLIPPSGGFTYQWYKSGSPIPGATSSTYTIQPSDRNSSITVEITDASGPVSSPAINTRSELPIFDADDLKKIRYADPDFPNSITFILQNNITLTSAWTPIPSFGDASVHTGIFDGNGYTINLGTHVTAYNAEIPPSTGTYRSYAGLFDRNYGRIKNLKLSGSIGSLTFDSSIVEVYVGAVVGENMNNGIIENVSSNVAINIIYGETGIPQIGGIAGRNLGTIRNCNSTGHISGEHSNIYTGKIRIGGIAGELQKGSITYCWASSQVDAGGTPGSYAGGIAGGMSNAGSGSDYGTITNCVALNSVAIVTMDVTVGRIVSDLPGSPPPQPSTLSKNYGTDEYPPVGSWVNNNASAEDGGNFPSSPFPSTPVSGDWTTVGIGPEWSFAPSKASADETNPWYWDDGSSRPRLWFE